MPAKRKGNREKLVPVILDRIARGETLRAICREDGMPSRDQFDQWRREDDVIARAVNFFAIMLRLSFRYGVR